MKINADLHIHGCFSMATSKNMLPKVIAPQASLKGLDLVGTGDALHLKWLQIIEESTEEIEEGILSIKPALMVEGATGNFSNFVLTTEVEDIRRVHHLLILPSLRSAYHLRENLKGNTDSDGRPKIHMQGGEIMDIAREAGCLVGPSHAFTPWTSIYKEYNSIYDCYHQKIDFLELGLSADSDMADRINELQNVPFLTNSDAHSPWPHRLGREFNQFELKELSFQGLKDAILKNQIIANYGFDPRLGKYHKTACTKCYQVFEIERALRHKMKCPCGGTIKKGVDYRIYELSTWKKPHHPKNRPPYIHILPLAEIISLIHNKGVTTVFVQKIWKELIQKYGNEISVLINASLGDLKDIDPKLAPVIKAFRENKLQIEPGGGGRYGRIVFDEINSDKISEKPKKNSDHPTLDDYF